MLIFLLRFTYLWILPGTKWRLSLTASNAPSLAPPVIEASCSSSKATTIAIARRTQFCIVSMLLSEFSVLVVFEDFYAQFQQSLGLVSHGMLVQVSFVFLAESLLWVCRLPFHHWLIGLTRSHLQVSSEKKLLAAKPQTWTRKCLAMGRQGCRRTSTMRRIILEGFQRPSALSLVTALVSPLKFTCIVWNA